ncbi:cytochrome c oxidase subunit 6a, mitochondrial-like [Phragmites australis]|uniref:cytochrome c oxidase subunit 6a, mitochondrial-like n=1 Tax=Phragmites australis TaxID=29695 RepID=UPI002D780849|nr:cytochrome c oxidase subunit 6a, mitochondrial-like [Phragmites australis]
MAAPMARFLANAAAKRSGGPALRRRFASSARHDDAQEAAKWERITFFGIATCTVLAIYHLSRGHQHFPDPPPYPYLHIRNKEFPWGPDGLFERKKNSDHH